MNKQEMLDGIVAMLGTLTEEERRLFEQFLGAVLEGRTAA